MKSELSLDGMWERKLVFIYNKLDEDGTGNYFETSEAKTVQPTRLLDSVTEPIHLVTGKLLRVHYRLNPTNAVTYTLRLWTNTINGAVDPYESNLALLYESAVARADDTDYDVPVVVPFILAANSLLYYSVEWSGAPGNTPGFIEASGEVIA